MTHTMTHNHLQVDDEQSAEHSRSDGAARYRLKVRPKVSSAYDGNRHLTVLLLSSLIGVIAPLCCLRTDSSVELLWQTAIVVPVALLYGNFAEYMAHRFGGHAPKTPRIPGVVSFRKYHAVVHHSFFSSGAWETERPSDLFFVAFPSWIYVFWALCVATPLTLVGPLLVAGGSTPFLLVTSTLSYTLLQYEALHAFNHRALPPSVQSLLERSPALCSMQDRHRLHHLKADVNFNITWPWTDRLLGTLASEEIQSKLLRHTSE